MASLLKPRGKLFRKYAVLFVTLVTGALLANGLIEIYFSYQENKTALARIQREKALAAALKIEHFVSKIELQISWIATWGASGVRPDEVGYHRLLRKDPAITEVRYIDSAGKEQLHVSRLGMDREKSGADFSHNPAFSQSIAKFNAVWPPIVGKTASISCFFRISTIDFLVSGFR